MLSILQTLVSARQHPASASGRHCALTTVAWPWLFLTCGPTVCMTFGLLGQPSRYFSIQGYQKQVRQKTTTAARSSMLSAMPPSISSRSLQWLAEKPAPYVNQVNDAAGLSAQDIGNGRSCVCSGDHCNKVAKCGCQSTVALFRFSGQGSSTLSLHENGLTQAKAPCTTVPAS
jgi:hypothetical protein